ncbi:TetR family transcriptional regulator [Streptomyces sp. NPDC047072]|uniref:TetR/AcrR family transcriptional regulator n=1 Tax=Streptomyces sp. NPDC047072 TaxID=3154809 RepID=UPI0033F9823B
MTFRPRATAAQPGTGLRERKKAQTRARIQTEALKLFRERGYEATTVQQIAQAAEVAHTTVFRYFPTKEDLVISDDYDPLLYEALRAQPPRLEPVEALRAALHTILDSLPAESFAAGRERVNLMLSEPALRGAIFENFLTTMRTVTAILAERADTDPRDLSMRVPVAAAFGTFLDLMLRWSEDPGLRLPEAVDEALDFLGPGR